MAFEFIKAALEQREQENLLRRVKLVNQKHEGMIHCDGEYLINFAGNDYLGLSEDQDVLQSYAEGLAECGAGSTASPVICGYHSYHQGLQERLAELTGQQSAMLFSSGFAANHAICQALAKPSPNKSMSVGIVSDKLMHASFIEAAMAYSERFFRFRHNQPKMAQKHIQKGEFENYLVASEGVFSMDGDCAPVSELISLKRKLKNTWIMLDQAHAIGVIGENGCGISDQTHYSNVDIVMGTFGKALGTQGAFVAGSDEFISYMQNFARHYVYSTAPAPAVAKATDTALSKMIESPLRTLLHQNISQFRQLCAKSGIGLTDSKSAIQPLLISGSTSVIEAADFLRGLGLLVGAIRSPTVPQNEERLRITICANHTEKDIASLVDGLCILREKKQLTFDNAKSKHKVYS